MPVIEVLLEVPPAIAQGLANGTLERVGGVIREVGSKQIVVWLREGGKIASNPNILTGLVQATGGVGSVATGILNTVVSAHSHDLIMRALKTQGMLIGTMGILNIAISGCTLYILNRRINRLGEQIEKIAAEFDRDRWNKLSAALESMRDVAEAEGDSYKRDVLRLNQELNEGRKHILDKVEDRLKDSIGSEQGQIAQDYLLLAMQVDTMRIRCYLETDEHKLARDRLKGRLEDYRERTGVFVHQLLGVHRARYFHELVGIDDLQRYIHIEGWLRRKDDVLMDVIEKSRKDFWNQDAIQDIIPGRSLPGRPPEKPIHHLTALAQAEILIENFQRLEGFEDELAAIERLGLKEWEDLNNTDVFNIEDDFNIAEHDDYVLLVDTDMLKRLSA